MMAGAEYGHNTNGRSIGRVSRHHQHQLPCLLRSRTRIRGDPSGHHNRLVALPWLPRRLTVGIEDFGITESLRHWVNDGLMTLFFFLLGLEIKREVLVGELRSPRQAALPLYKEVETPLTHFQHQLSPWVAYAILPLFAFANAGVPLGGVFSQLLATPVTWGVVVGLVVGKPLGITLFSWLAVQLGVALLPPAISWRQIIGVAWLGGIGFTISLFIAELAFGADPLGDAARVGILVGSVVAGVIGFGILRAILPPPQ
jgi:Na+/H+ antiporter NhaA